MYECLSTVTKPLVIGNLALTCMIAIFEVLMKLGKAITLV